MEYDYPVKHIDERWRCEHPEYAKWMGLVRMFEGFSQARHDRALCARAERAQAAIDDEDVRLFQEPARQGDLLALAMRQTFASGADHEAQTCFDNGVAQIEIEQGFTYGLANERWSIGQSMRYAAKQNIRFERGADVKPIRIVDCDRRGVAVSYQFRNAMAGRDDLAANFVVE